MCLLMVTPASYSQIAVGPKGDFILVNLVTGLSMSLPALNQRKNIITLSSRIGDKQGSATQVNISQLREIKDTAREFIHMMRVGYNFMDNLHKLVISLSDKRYVLIFFTPNVFLGLPRWR